MSDPDDKRRLHDEHAAREPAHEPIAARKILLQRRRPDGEFGDDEAARGELVRERAIAGGIDAIGTGADHRDAAAGAGESAAMRGGIDAERESADDRETGGGHARRANASASAQPLRGCIAAAHDGEGRARQKLAPAEAVEHGRRIADFEQRRPGSPGRPRRRDHAQGSRARRGVASSRAAVGRRVEQRPRRLARTHRRRCAGVAASTPSGVSKARKSSTSGRGAIADSWSRAHASARGSTFMAKGRRGFARRGSSPPQRVCRRATTGCGRSCRRRRDPSC